MTKRLEKSFDISPAESKCLTDQIPLYGGDISNYAAFFDKWKTEFSNHHHLDTDIAQHLIESYGSRLPDVLEYIESSSDGKERILPGLHYIWGELDYALEHEMTVALDDFLIRRTHLFSLDRKQALDVHEEIASRLAKKLSWSEEEKKAQIERYKSKIEITRWYLRSS
ncbi:hypothetical protein GWN26_07070 [Candidatus Saccharibacteria bacterium]|nr:hypothetical protein [Candidatus Saccharibacteria bacterium]